MMLRHSRSAKKVNSHFHKTTEVTTATKYEFLVV